MTVEWLWYALFGALGGILGGMGMGGGTLLIPLLGIFCGVSQHSAQAVNLISFIPMATAALVVHIKKGRVDFKNSFLIIISGIYACVVGCFIAKAVSGAVLKRCFGGALVILAVYLFVTGLKK